MGATLHPFIVASVIKMEAKNLKNESALCIKWQGNFVSVLSNTHLPYLEMVRSDVIKSFQPFFQRRLHLFNKGDVKLDNLMTVFLVTV